VVCPLRWLILPSLMWFLPFCSLYSAFVRCFGLFLIGGVSINLYATGLLLGKLAFSYKVVGLFETFPMIGRKPI